MTWAALAAAALASSAVASGQRREEGSRYASIPADSDRDLKLYAGDGRIATGTGALGRMQEEAGVILWMAGNQFMAMDDVIGEFQRSAPGTAVGLITLPPGLLLSAIEKGGWTDAGKDYPGRPDVYASVDFEHLQRLGTLGLMRSYAVYLHNELELMVAAGNPKGISGLEDLARADIRTSMPNPINEGIMRFYAKKTLQRHGLWEHISGGRECESCQTTSTNWFTSVHHRETPERILAGLSDTGIVWATETLNARRAGMKVEGVGLPPEDSLRDEVSYAIGALTDARHGQTAARFLSFLATPAAQDAYGAFGFTRATAEELTLRAIP